MNYSQEFVDFLAKMESVSGSHALIEAVREGYFLTHPQFEGKLKDWAKKGLATAALAGSMSGCMDLGTQPEYSAQQQQTYPSYSSSSFKQDNPYVDPTYSSSSQSQLDYYQSIRDQIGKDKADSLDKDDCLIYQSSTNNPFSSVGDMDAISGIPDGVPLKEQCKSYYPSSSSSATNAMNNTKSSSSTHNTDNITDDMCNIRYNKCANIVKGNMSSLGLLGSRDGQRAVDDCKNVCQPRNGNYASWCSDKRKKCVNEKHQFYTINGRESEYNPNQAIAQCNEICDL